MEWETGRRGRYRRHLALGNQAGGWWMVTSEALKVGLGYARISVCTRVRGWVNYSYSLEVCRIHSVEQLLTVREHVPLLGAERLKAQDAVGLAVLLEAPAVRPVLLSHELCETFEIVAVPLCQGLCPGGSISRQLRQYERVTQVGVWAA